MPASQPLTEEQKALVEQYLPLAHTASNVFLSRCWYARRCRDVVNDGAITHLIYCAQRYDAERGASFKTFYLELVNKRLFALVRQHIAGEKELLELKREAPAIRRDQERTSGVTALIAIDQLQQIMDKAELTPIQRQAVEEFLSMGRSRRTKAEWASRLKGGTSKYAVHSRFQLALLKMRKCVETT